MAGKHGQFMVAVPDHAEEEFDIAPELVQDQSHLIRDYLAKGLVPRLKIAMSKIVTVSKRLFAFCIEYKTFMVVWPTC